MTSLVLVGHSPELLRALRAPARPVWSPFVDALRNAGGPVVVLVLGAIAIAAATVLVQALLLRSVLDLGYWLGIVEHRLGAAAALLTFLLARVFAEGTLMRDDLEGTV